MSAPVTVKVTVRPRLGRNGYWCAGRHFPDGESIAVLEDAPGLSVEQALAQLRHAEGGQALVGQDDFRGFAGRAPAILTVEVLEDLDKQTNTHDAATAARSAT